MTMTETWLTAALVLVHLCGFWLMFALVEEHYGKYTVAQNKVMWALLCFFIWEGVCLWTMFEKTDPKRIKK